MTEQAARELWLRRVSSIKRHGRSGERAVHKPLLLLYALGRFQDGERSVPWTTAEPDLQRMLDDFGPPNATKPNHPFRRLANDDQLWDLRAISGDLPGVNASPAQLRAAGVVGSFSDDFVAALEGDPGLSILLARFLLEDNWPPSLHESIALAVGLNLDSAERELVRERLDLVVRQRRDPSFRPRILQAYEYRCAVCGYDGWLDRSAVGLEAAHVRWWSSDGPDTVDNGMAVCSLHHVLFDGGALGITADYRVTISKRFVGRSPSSRQLVVALAGSDLLLPQAGEPPPRIEHVEWHSEQVFRGPARTASPGASVNSADR